MAKRNFWVSAQLTNEILWHCGNQTPTDAQSTFMADLLSYVVINPVMNNILHLSERERTCLFWVAQGKTVEEIALLMQIKACTVQTYRRRILTKLHCHSLAQAVFLTMCYQPFAPFFTITEKNHGNY
jgi:DNA-binding CsgD family transcriptional regulator